MDAQLLEYLKKAQTVAGDQRVLSYEQLSEILGEEEHIDWLEENFIMMLSVLDIECVDPDLEKIVDPESAKIRKQRPYWSQKTPFPMRNGLGLEV